MSERTLVAQIMHALTNHPRRESWIASFTFFDVSVVMVHSCGVGAFLITMIYCSKSSREEPSARVVSLFALVFCS